MKLVQKNLQNNSLKILSLVLSNFLVSCEERSTEFKELNVNNILITVPHSWKGININSFDSQLSALVTEYNDTIFFDKGRYSNSFEKVITIRSIERKKMYDSAGYDYSKNIIFSETPEIDELQGLYLQEYYFYENIDKYKVKLGFPKIIKKGYCLASFGRIDNKGNKLSIYSKNVDSLTQNRIYHMFKSVKILNEKVIR